MGCWCCLRRPSVWWYLPTAVAAAHSPRNNQVACVLQERQIGTVRLDLPTPEEDQEHHHRFDIPLLTQRLLSVTRWLRLQQTTHILPLAYFGASAGCCGRLDGRSRARG